MPIYRPIVRLAAVCWFISAAGLFAAQNALIVIGTTGTSTNASELSTVAQNIQTGLVQRGFAPDSIEILGAASSNGKVTSDQVMASLKKRQSLGSTDEFWLILLGFSAPNSEGAPAFQVSGPRLAAPDLKSALDAIPAQQFVFVGTSSSGGFVPILLKAGRTILAATKEDGEIDLPRLPEYWAAALKENPKAGWKWIAAQAAALNDKAYADQSLTVAEHARLGDPATGQILEAPFGVDLTAKPEAEKPQPDGSMALINAADIKVDIRKPNAEWESHDATPETKKLIADARAVPNLDGYNAIVLEQKLGYTIGEDRSAEDYVMRRVYIEKEDGIERWANYTFPQDPPATTTKLEAARVILPDGSSTVFNPAKLPPATSVSSESGALTTVFLPNVHAGCMVELAYHTRHLLDVDLPDFSEELPVQLDVPALHTELQIVAPVASHLHFKLRNGDQKATDVVANGIRTVSWKLDNLPAFESLPNDPPARDLMIALNVSSLESWDDFANWYRRLSRGSDIQDDAVKAKAAELADGTKTRMEKIRRAYEFVSALRYVAIECGINGIRPRSPAVVLSNRYGDCKDKANLLIALLGDMGVDAKFVVLNRGSSTDTTFPSWQFNHAIAYVPKAPDAGQPDDLWLDTTDSTAPFPTLSPGDIGRNALIFDKDSAKFLPVTALGRDATNVEENWSVQLNYNDGTHPAAKGTLQITWTGLAEYDVRAFMRGRSPLQRDYELQQSLAKRLPDADFTNFNLTPVDDLSKPMQLDAQFKIGPLFTWSWPKPIFDVSSMFAASERNRSLLINNGQKLHLIQTVEAYGALDKTPANFDQTTAGIHASITWKTGDHTLTRTDELTIDQPLIAQADYIPVRQMLRDWVQHLSP